MVLFFTWGTPPHSEFNTIVKMIAGSLSVDCIAIDYRSGHARANIDSNSSKVLAGIVGNSHVRVPRCDGATGVVRTRGIVAHILDYVVVNSARSMRIDGYIH